MFPSKEAGPGKACLAVGQPAFDPDAKMRPLRMASMAGNDDSEDEDPPENSYELYWRIHDRQILADPRRRKKSRTAAQGWPRTPALTLDSYLLTSRHGFRQGTHDCMAYCAAFFALRRYQLSPAQCIGMLSSPGMRRKASAWQKRFHDALKVAEFAGSAISECLSMVAAELDDLPVFSTTPVRTPDHVPQPDDIHFLELLGSFPPQNCYLQHAEKMLSIHLRRGKNAVSSMPSTRPTTLKATLQKTLFGRYFRPLWLSYPSSAGSGPLVAQRTAQPFILLELFYPRDKIVGHAILIDLSDPAQPGIFDPNFGWLEPPRGFVYLSFEKALHLLWEHYARHDRVRPTQGMTGMSQPDGNLYTMIASQIYTQVLPASVHVPPLALAERPPEKEKTDARTCDAPGACAVM